MKLRRHLKGWFVPHKHNDHRPHLIRAHGLALFVATVLALQGAAYATRPVMPAGPVGGAVLPYATDINPVELVKQTNAARATNGLPALRNVSALNQSAYLKAQNMFQEDYWAHVSPSGLQPWYWFTQAGYKYSYAGENLAKDFDTTSGTMEGWMNSPGHRANILNRNYTEVGFAVVNGTLQGGQTTLVVAHYGTPAGTTAAANVVASTPAPQPKPAPTVNAATTTPAPAPAGTPEPTPPPTVSPALSPSPTAMPATNAAAPPPKSYSLFEPLTLTRTLNWSTLLTLVLLLTLFLVYVATHLAVWRKGLRRWQRLHYRVAAGAQLAGLAGLLLYLATSGFGRVG